MSAEVRAGAVPLLPGALSLTAAGFVSGGTRNNIAYLAPWASFASGVPDDVAILLQDAQTSGGLLLASSAPDALLAELAAREVPAVVIGQVTADPPGTSPSACSIRGPRRPVLQGTARVTKPPGRGTVHPRRQSICAPAANMWQARRAGRPAGRVSRPSVG